MPIVEVNKKLELFIDDRQVYYDLGCPVGRISYKKRKALLESLGEAIAASGATRGSVRFASEKCAIVQGGRCPIAARADHAATMAKALKKAGITFPVRTDVTPIERKTGGLTCYANVAIHAIARHYTDPLPTEELEARHQFADSAEHHDPVMQLRCTAYAKLMGLLIDYRHHKTISQDQMRDMIQAAQNLRQALRSAPYTDVDRWNNWDIPHDSDEFRDFLYQEVLFEDKPFSTYTYLPEGQDQVSAATWVNQLDSQPPVTASWADFRITRHGDDGQPRQIAVEVPEGLGRLRLMGGVVHRSDHYYTYQQRPYLGTNIYTWVKIDDQSLTEVDFSTVQRDLATDGYLLTYQAI